MRLPKLLGAAGALILSALIGGTLITTVLASDDSDVTDPSAADAGYCDTFMDAFAAELGTTRDGVLEAGKAAANAAIDAAVAAGDLSDDRAAALRERIDAAEGHGCGLLGIGWARGFHHGVARGVFGADVFEAAADALGIDSAELIGQVRDAGSLQALAEQLNVAYDGVKAAVLAAVRADLDSAVDEGLSPERADAAIERLTSWLDDGGQLPGPGRASVGGPSHEERHTGPFGGEGL
jgi:hypothetical protein